MILGKNRLNQISATIDLRALKFNSFLNCIFIKFNLTFCNECQFVGDL